MTKTLAEIRENLSIDAVQQGLGVVRGIAAPISVMNIRTFAQQISNALQPTVPQVVSRIETELHKFGFSLGEVDTTNFPDNGEDDFVVFAYPDGDEVTNLFLSLEWRRVSPGDTKYRSETLEYSITLTVNDIAPDQFDDLINSGIPVDSETAELTET